MDSDSLSLVPVPLAASAGADSALTVDAREDLLAHYWKAAGDYAKEARSVATQRAYTADWRDFEQWCRTLSLIPLPAEPRTVAAYLAALAERGRKAATISRRRTTISLVHRRAGLPSPCDQQQVLVMETMQGIRRRIGTRQQGKEPASLDLIRKSIRNAEGTLAASRDRAILLIGFAGGLRRSELAAMRVDDLEWVGRGLTVHLRKSKTDQEGRGREVEFLYGAQPEGTPLSELTCPVRVLAQWLKQANIEKGFVFRRISHAQTILGGLEPRSIANIIKKAFSRGGVSEKDLPRYGAHSLRAGFATTAWANGATELAIMRQTGHKSNAMVRKYIRSEKADRIEAASKLGL